MSGPQTREKLGRRSGQAIFNANPDLGRGRRYEPTGIPYDPPKGEPYTPNPDFDIQKEGYPLSPMSGLGMIERGKDIYNKFRPELNNDMFNFNLGNWNFGIGEDKFGLGYNRSLGGAGTHPTRRPVKEGIESLTDSPDFSDFYMDKIIRDNPEHVYYNLMRQYPTPELQEYYDQPIDRYQLDFGGPEIDKWISENPGSTIGDLYDYLPELGRSGPQPGDFWPEGAMI